VCPYKERMSVKVPGRKNSEASSGFPLIKGDGRGIERRFRGI
jgi:hypothetical protein